MNAVRPDTTESALPDAPWPRVKLGEVCEFSADGDWIESKDQALSGIRLIQTGNIGNGRFENKAEKSRFVSEDTFSRLHCTEIFPGDVLVSRLPDPVGRACKLSDIGQRMITAVDCTILRFKDVVDSDFFILYSQSPDYRLQIESLISGSTRARISRKNLEQISIPLPSLSVQRSIVARLDAELARADRMREQFLALAESAAARFRAILAETFEQGETGDFGSSGVSGSAVACSGSDADAACPGGPGNLWPQVSFEKHCRLLRGTYTTQSAEEPGNIPVILGGREPAYYIARSNHEGACLVVSRSGASAGFVSRWNQPIFVTDGFIIEFDEFFDFDFAYYFFKSAQESLTGLNQGAAIPHVTGQLIKSLEIPLPPLPVQRSIVARLDAARADCGRIEELARKGAEGCAALRAALLKEAFE